MVSKINFFNIFSKKDYLQFIAVLILSFLPLFFFMGTGVLNAAIIILDFIFIIEILSKKRLFFLKNYIFYSLLLLWVTLLINVFFSIDPINSFYRGFGFIRFVFFVMLIIYYFNLENKIFQNTILFWWLSIFIVTSVDLIFEFINGKNILGFASYMPGRLAGFFNDELIVGHFYYGFVLIIIFSITFLFSEKKFFKNNKKFEFKNIIYLFIFIFLLISFLIGERSNFIKVFIMILLFTFLYDKKLFKLKIILFSSFFLIIILLLNSNPAYKNRFINQIFKPMYNYPIEYFNNSIYFQHYRTALKVYDNNKIFGVGLKNYRIEVNKNIYKNLNASIHPHQVHFEFLSELGLVGYIFMILFFIFHFYKFRKNKPNNDNLNLSGLLFIITSLLPILPSGSFFTSNAAALFWMNFAFMCLNQKRNNYDFFN